ncbi:hypothetical protein [Nocardia brasiliensis]|uniref:hypothetical protein n=1 Tax=Nocardia brasiliensis TaxID=37326 RepID=UPI0002F771B6|nr:hypothetical protein [Nocardia brasiliensis]ASF11792.1 hypothetical protein CEQ30_35620 [Nocardia brasiliensis]SUB09378.1 Uncharacterised protein [Nocardia brasiliensis]
MSTHPPQEERNSQPSPPPPAPPWRELAAAVATAAPVGLLVDWPTAVQVLLTVFAGLTAARRCPDHE